MSWVYTDLRIGEQTCSSGFKESWFFRSEENYITVDLSEDGSLVVSDIDSTYLFERCAVYGGEEAVFYCEYKTGQPPDLWATNHIILLQLPERVLQLMKANIDRKSASQIRERKYQGLDFEH